MGKKEIYINISKKWNSNFTPETKVKTDAGTDVSE